MPHTHTQQNNLKSDSGCHELLLKEELLFNSSNLKKRGRKNAGGRQPSFLEFFRKGVSKTNCYVSSV